jgi:hypothetical protein
MNTNTVKMMIAAAALVVAAGSASAQSFKAEVPVAFKVGNKTMAPGSYDIRMTETGAGATIVVRNRNENTAAVLIPNVKGDAPKAWQEAGDPKLAFGCSDGTCTLRSIWNGSDSFAYKLPAPKAARDLASVRTEIVTLSMIKAR